MIQTPEMTTNMAQLPNILAILSAMRLHQQLVPISLGKLLKVGHYRSTSKMPFKWYFAGGLIVA